MITVKQDFTTKEIKVNAFGYEIIAKGSDRIRIEYEPALDAFMKIEFIDVCMNDAISNKLSSVFSCVRVTNNVKEVNLINVVGEQWWLDAFDNA